MNRKLEILLVEFKDNLKTNYDLKKKNWFNIGGKVRYLSLRWETWE